MHSHTLTHITMLWAGFGQQHLCRKPGAQSSPPPAPRLPSCSHVAALTGTCGHSPDVCSRNPLRQWAPCLPGYVCLHSRAVGHRQSTWLNTKGSGSRSGSSLSTSWKEALCLGVPPSLIQKQRGPLLNLSGGRGIGLILQRKEHPC